MNIVKQLENAPRNLVLYGLGLVGAVVDDYTLVTLLIFAILLGFLTSVLIAAAVFFGAYFVLRLVMNVADAIALNAQAQRQAADVQSHATAQAGHMVANSIGNAAALRDGNTRGANVMSSAPVVVREANP